MDFPTLNVFLSLILTVASVWNTGETGDMYEWKEQKRKKEKLKRKRKREIKQERMILNGKNQ